MTRLRTKDCGASGLVANTSEYRGRGSQDMCVHVFRSGRRSGGGTVKIASMCNANSRAVNQTFEAKNG